MIICEELACVRSPGKAAEYLNRLINQSLAFGLLIVGTVQRGQEVDKSMLNSASYVHVAKHSTEDDAIYLAKKLGIPDSEVPRTKLKFIQWTSDRGIVCWGNIDFKGAKSKSWTRGGPRFINAHIGKIMGFERDGRLKGVVYR
ncbi:MAG: hypothetical protein CENE_03470 [Candidatus Celerinatantimonas neptuna]|nr:MAG: hypothetical protein CENE_03470 [Candidatus Celerinatantimonas neptuna]